MIGQLVKRFVGQDRAAAAVEFALVLPLLLVILFGIIDFGRILFITNALTSMARDGGRFASVQPCTVDLQSATRSYLMGGQASRNIMGGDPLPQSAIVVSTASIGGVQNVIVQIQNYTIEPLTPLPALIGLGSVTPQPRATFRRERVC